MGLEPILYELMRLVSLPLNYLGIQHHYIWSVSNPPSTLCKSYSTCKLIRSCCVVYTTKHPWCVRSFTTVYKCRMVTRGGIEPTVLAVKERCLNHLTNGPCVTPILTKKPLCGGECGIRTHGTFLFDSFQDCCINPGSANSPCNSPIKSCTL